MTAGPSSPGGCCAAAPTAKPLNKIIHPINAIRIVFPYPPYRPGARQAKTNAMSTEADIVFYLARADNGVIGSGQSLPWHLPADLKRFKRMTMGKAMIMGRKTFESFGGPLPGRRHIVLTRNAGWEADGAETCHTVKEALNHAGDSDELAVVGGGEIYELLLPYADRIELTEVHIAPSGDTLAPEFPDEEWEETAREDHEADGDTPGYSFVTLIRR